MNDLGQETHMHRKQPWTISKTIKENKNTNLVCILVQHSILLAI